MQIEYIPILVGVVVGLLGIGLVFDAMTPDDLVVNRERRRSPRAERSRPGEAAVGFGILGMAAAFVGRDGWPYSVISVMAGTALLLIGTWANRVFLRETIGNRGPMRRR